MFIFAASDKGGTGRSVTSSNLLYRSALQGNDVCYLDFDFGSPTSGAIFGIERAENGISTSRGLHSYLLQEAGEPDRIDVWEETDRPSVRDRPGGSGRLVLLPGDLGGADFSRRTDIVERTAALFSRLDEEFQICLVDLSAGRNLAVETALRVMALPSMRKITSRWLVYHRWTKQHVIAAGGLVHGPHGLLPNAKEYGHDPMTFMENLRFVRTAVIDPNSRDPKQSVLLREYDDRLARLAGKHQVGRSYLLGSVPLDPVLQWQEQLITDDDVVRGLANEETRNAFTKLARDMVDGMAWETL